MAGTPPASISLSINDINKKSAQAKRDNKFGDITTWYDLAVTLANGD